MKQVKKPAKQVRLSYLTFSLLLEEMLSGPCTAEALAEHTGMGHRYIRRLLDTMHSKKVAHISGWEKDAYGRWCTRVWALGPGRDKPKPSPKTKKAINRDFSQRSQRRALQAAFFNNGNTPWEQSPTTGERA